jgi:hypothetical protein
MSFILFRSNFIGDEIDISWKDLCEMIQIQEFSCVNRCRLFLPVVYCEYALSRIMGCDWVPAIDGQRSILTYHAFDW